MCGVVDGGIVDGLWGYEAGQSGVGDLFGWFVDNGVPRRVPRRRPTARGVERARPPHRSSPRRRRSASTACSPSTGTAATARCSSTTSCPASSSGSPSTTRPEDVYRALVEATAFGARTIVETFVGAGVPVDEFIVAGGLTKNRLLMQIYADVLRLPLSVIGSEQGPALGSAIHAAVAAGAYPDVPAAAAAMGSVHRAVYAADRGRRRSLRRAVRRVHRAARPLRPRRQRRDAPAEAASAARSATAAHRDGRTPNVAADDRAGCAPRSPRCTASSSATASSCGRRATSRRACPAPTCS